MEAFTACALMLWTNWMILYEVVQDSEFRCSLHVADAKPNTIGSHESNPIPVGTSDIISTHASLQTLHSLALTETWIIPENTATPAALSTA